MTMPNLTRAQIERAGSLEFERPAEKQATITIEVAPDGLHVRAEYIGTLSSIPAAIERLRAAGVIQLVEQSKPATPVAPAATPRRQAAPRVEPVYPPDGTACCPVHRKTLSEGRYGLFCPAKAKAGEEQNDKGYCNLKFAE